MDSGETSPEKPAADPVPASVPAPRPKKAKRTTRVTATAASAAAPKEGTTPTTTLKSLKTQPVDTDYCSVELPLASADASTERMMTEESLRSFVLRHEEAVQKIVQDNSETTMRRIRDHTEDFISSLSTTSRASEVAPYRTPSPTSSRSPIASTECQPSWNLNKKKVSIFVNPPCSEKKKGQGGTDSSGSTTSMEFGGMWTDAAERTAEQTRLAASLRGGVFGALDTEAMTNQCRAGMAAQDRCVSRYYWETGFCQMVARHPMFEVATLVVIAINSIWLAYDMDENQAAILVDASPLFIFADNFFCFYYMGEWSIRFGALQVKANGLRDFWMVFDGILCAVMVFETWIMTLVFIMTGTSGSVGNASILRIFRLAKLFRLGRLARLLHSVPELLVVVKGIGQSLRAVTCCFALMLCACYVFAIVMRQASDGTGIGERHYPSVLYSMRYLLTLGCAPDVADAVEETFNEGLGLAIIFSLFIVIIGITIMNMVVGILVGVMETVAAVEKEEMLVTFVRSTLLDLFETHIYDRVDLDVDHDDEPDDDHCISKIEFEHLVKVPYAVRSLEQMGVDAKGLEEMSEFLFRDDQNIRFHTFMEMVMQLRGSKLATVKDIVDLRRFIVSSIAQLHEALSDEMRRREKREYTRQKSQLLRERSAHSLHSRTSDSLMAPESMNEDAPNIHVEVPESKQREKRSAKASDSSDPVVPGTQSSTTRVVDAQSTTRVVEVVSSSRVVESSVTIKEKPTRKKAPSNAPDASSTKTGEKSLDSITDPLVLRQTSEGSLPMKAPRTTE